MFYRDDVERMNRVLREFLKLSGAKSNILIDKEGHLITKVGAAPSVDTDTLSALVAAAFLATREMARILGESEFSLLSHQGKHDHLQLSLVADRCILTTLFNDQTNTGMVRLYSTQAVKKLELIFEEIASRREHPQEDLGGDWEGDAEIALDDVFG